jgi:biotin synthase
MGTHQKGLPDRAEGDDGLSREEIIGLLESEGEDRERLFFAADRTRAQYVGDAVHLRGIIEFSNYCIKNCLYCGLRKDNSKLERYRMSPDEILEAAAVGVQAGIKTIVLQSGEDPFFTGEILARLIGRLKDEHDVAVTAAFGDRSRSDYRLMRKAGADRYLLKHETADAALFATLRPGTTLDGRRKRLTWLKDLGFQVGSGNMVGLPWQTIETLAEDVLFMRDLDVEMAGIGPFIPNGDTPLAGCAGGSVDMTLKTLAVLRLLLPFAHLPATTALASIHPEGHQMALRHGANVVMPDITPVRYKKLYRIYPNKISITEDGVIESIPRISGMIRETDRSVALDFGHSGKPAFRGSTSRRKRMVGNG